MFEDITVTLCLFIFFTTYYWNDGRYYGSYKKVQVHPKASFNSLFAVVLPTVNHMLQLYW